MHPTMRSTWFGRPVRRLGGGAPKFEALEKRELLSTVLLGQELRSFSFLDRDGDTVVVALQGPGTATLLTGEGTGSQPISLLLEGTDERSSLSIRVKQSSTGDGRVLLGSVDAGSLGKLKLQGVQFGPESLLEIAGALGALEAPAAVQGLRIRAESVGSVRIGGSLMESTIAAAGSIGSIRIGGDLGAGTTLAAGTDIDAVSVHGEMRGASILAGAVLTTSGSLSEATWRPASMQRVRIGGAVVDSLIVAGGAPGADGLFQDGEVLPGGSIDSLVIGGALVGAESAHPQPGVYAAKLRLISVAGNDLTGKSGAGLAGVEGSAIVDPLPAPGIALSEPEIRRVLEQAIARATQLGVNATISMVDREGNILAAVRMTNGALVADPGTSTISAGGVGGLEGVTVPSSITATSKAGTAAFLSSEGNAFSTRTAGFIIQPNFPRGIRFRPSGPLFGVQFSNLPTSDVNQLPLGLAADPGGVPLYRDGQVVAGIGVELDGLYTAPGSNPGVSSKPSLEEQVALAGQVGFEPPKQIRATRILVDGLRLPLKEAKSPTIASLGALPNFAAQVLAGELDVLVAPQVSPPSMFTTATLGSITGETILRTGGTLTIAGAMTGGQQLTAPDVELILQQAHELNARLRAQIRKDRPQVSQVNVTVVDTQGEILGTFRNSDAPVFGFDVSAQKARTAAFFSRPDAGALLGAAEGGAFADYVARAMAFGFAMDGTVAVSDRTGGFLSRPTFPDGIPGTQPGPFSVHAPDVFSPFNTGLQTALLTTNLVAFLSDFAAVGNEGLALSQFNAGLIGGGGVTAPSLPLANGTQIFPGSVPLYKNGVLVGAIGVSGDGIEQDDFVAFSGAEGFQSFGAGVVRADNVVLMNVRLPYVKFPRNPFAGK